MNSAFWLSIVLGVVGITGIFIAGKGKWQGWALGLAIQPVWFIFAIVTEAYGLLLICFGYAFVYANNLIKWRRDHIIDQCAHTNARSWVRTIKNVQYVQRCPDCKKAWIDIDDFDADTAYRN